MQSIKLNLIPGSVLPVINVSQYDAHRQFQLVVYEGATAYSLTGKTVEIRGTKPDGNGFAYDAQDGVVSVSNNVVTISTTQQMTAVGGHVMTELRITSGQTILGTLNFIMDVEPSALSDDTPISETEIPAIERQLEELVEEIQVYTEDAEAWGAGTRDGQPVPSSDPAYQNNAKYYAGNAGTSATNADTNALKSEGYAIGKQNGTDVDSSSQYYHNNAKYFDDSAQNAYTQTRTARDAAMTYKYGSEGWAVGTRDGQPVESSSPYYHNNADYYRSQASLSATAAAANSLEAEGWAVGEQNGVPVSSGSPYYHNNAKYYSEQANPTALSNLTDVNITTPSDGQALVYDGSKWVNDTVSGVPTGGTTNQVLAKNSNTDGDTKWMDVPSVGEVAALEETGAVNLLPNKPASQTINNVTFTHNADDTISAHRNSASTSSSILYMTDNNNVFTLPKGKYILSDGKSHNPYAWMFVSLVSGGTIIAQNIATTENGAAVFDTSPYTYDNMYIGVRVGMEQTADVTFKPMIYDARFGLNIPFMPYAMTNRELTDASVSFSSDITTLKRSQAIRYQLSNNNPSGVIINNCARFETFLITWQINSFGTNGMFWLHWRYDNTVIIRDVSGTAASYFSASLGADYIKLRTTNAAGGAFLYIEPWSTNKNYTLTRDDT